MKPVQVAVLVLLVLDAVVLAVLELLYLPLRFNGLPLPALPGDPPFPAAALVAAVTMPLLVWFASAISGKLSVAGAPMFAWLVALLVFGLTGPGGDAVLVPDWRALLLLAGGVLPAALMLGRVTGKAARDG